MWTFYSFTASLLACVFFNVCLNVAINDTCGVFFAEVLSLEAQLLLSSALAELCAVCPRPQQLGHGGSRSPPSLGMTHSPVVTFPPENFQSNFKAGKSDLSPCCPVSSSHMDGRCFSLDFSPACHVDLEIAAAFCITGGFFAPYLPV